MDLLYAIRIASKSVTIIYFREKLYMKTEQEIEKSGILEKLLTHSKS